MRVLCVGDLHTNPSWWDHVVTPLAHQLDADLIVCVGDLNYRPRTVDGAWFADQLAASDVPVYFCDGNHDDHDALADATTGTDRSAPVQLAGALHYLPRGSRFTVGGVRFCALGGAHSVDRATRTPGIDWFTTETVSDDDLAVTVAGGPTDVLITHDAPAGWSIPGLDAPTNPRWAAELPAAMDHRRRLASTLGHLQPRVVVHGHYHRRYRLAVDTPWGDLRVEGLDCDGTDGAFVVIDCDTTPTVTDLRPRLA